MPETVNTAKPQKAMFLELSFGADPAVAFAGHVSLCSVTPKTQTINWTGGDPDQPLSDTFATGYDLALNVMQDVENPDSLINVLIAHEGEEGTFTYGPHKSGVFRQEVTAVIPPVMIGGPVNAYNESKVTMGCSKPDTTQPA